MVDEFNNTFIQKCFDLKFDQVREWGKNHPQISNVLKGLDNECFTLLGDFNQTNEICFAYITHSIQSPGIILKLEFKEINFFYYLLSFALEITKINRKLEAISVYNTFLHQLRTFLEANEITTITSTEITNLKKVMGDGFLITPSSTVILKNFNRVDFYRKCFGNESFRNIEVGKEYVYVMLNEDEFSFKIGHSKNPKYREGTLQSKQPKIFLMKVWQCEKKIEKELHNIYKKNRIRGEWFKFDFGELCELDNTIDELINKENAK